LVTRSTFGVLGTNLTNYEYTAHGLTFGAQPGSYVFWGSFNDFLCFSSTHDTISIRSSIKFKH
jgi:hypothetical protein